MDGTKPTTWSSWSTGSISGKCDEKITVFDSDMLSLYSLLPFLSAHFFVKTLSDNDLYLLTGWAQKPLKAVRVMGVTFT